MEEVRSIFVVKRKANEGEVFGGKRLRLIGSYTTKPSENDIVAKISKSANSSQKRVILQDLNSSEFQQLISELPNKKTKLHSNPSSETQAKNLAVEEDDRDIYVDSHEDFGDIDPLVGYDLDMEELNKKINSKPQDENLEEGNNFPFNLFFKR